MSFFCVVFYSHLTLQISAPSQDHRDHIARSVMKLVLNELFTFRCMQTDPNWSNFLYDASTRQIRLIDFGATRFYHSPFMDDYMRVRVTLFLVNFTINFY